MPRKDFFKYEIWWNYWIGKFNKFKEIFIWFCIYFNLVQYYRIKLLLVTGYLLAAEWVNPALWINLYLTNKWQLSKLNTNVYYRIYRTKYHIGNFYLDPNNWIFCIMFVSQATTTTATTATTTTITTTTTTTTFATTTTSN